MTVIAKPRNNNSSKKSSFTLNFVYFNTSYITQKLLSWTVFFNVCMLFIVRLNVYIYDKYMYGYKYACNICSQLIKLTHLHEVISLNPSLGKSVSNPIIT